MNANEIFRLPPIPALSRFALRVNRRRQSTDSSSSRILRFSRSDCSFWAEVDGVSGQGNSRSVGPAVPTNDLAAGAVVGIMTKALQRCHACVWRSAPRGRKKEQLDREKRKKREEVIVGRVRRAHRTIVSARPLPRRNPTHTPHVGLRCANPTYQLPENIIPVGWISVAHPPSPRTIPAVGGCGAPRPCAWPGAPYGAPYPPLYVLFPGIDKDG
jgi:hypothetical protein